MSEALFISRFEQARPKKSMDFDCSTNYFVRELVMLHES